MASFRPPDPPPMEGIPNDKSMPGLTGPRTPPNNCQLSGLAILLTRLIADKGNFTANGELIINQVTVEMIQVLIRSEQERSEADKRCNERTREMANQMQLMADQINNLVKMQNQNSMTNGHASPAKGSTQPTYADQARSNIPTTAGKPTTQPPTKNGIRLYCPGRAVIHSNPLNNQIDKIPKALFVQ